MFIFNESQFYGVGLCLSEDEIYFVSKEGFITDEFLKDNINTLCKNAEDENRFRGRRVSCGPAWRSRKLKKFVSDFVNRRMVCIGHRFMYKRRETA